VITPHTTSRKENIPAGKSFLESEAMGEEIKKSLKEKQRENYLG